MSAFASDEKRDLADRLFARLAEREAEVEAAEEAGRVEGYEDGWFAALDHLIDLLEAKAARDSRALVRLGLLVARDEAQRVAEVGSRDEAA